MWKYTRRDFLSSIVVLTSGLSAFPAEAVARRNGTEAHSHTGSRAVETSLAGTSTADVPVNILDLQYQEISRYFLSQIAATPVVRDRLWQPDFSSIDSYRRSVAERRRSLREMLGFIKTVPQPPAPKVLATGYVRVEDVILPLVRDFDAQALLFVPTTSSPAAAIIAVPSAEETKEQFAGIAAGMKPAGWLTALLSRGVAVCVPATIERKMDSPLCRRLHKDRRRLLHRLGFIVGRTLTGLEVQQTESCWQEPVDRMLYGQLNQFGDAELAALIAPRPLTVLYTLGGATPQKSVEAEAARAMRFYRGLKKPDAFVFKGSSPDSALEAAAAQMADALGAPAKAEAPTLTFCISAGQMEQSRNDRFEALHRYLRRLDGESDDVRMRHWQLLSTGPAERPKLVQRLRGELGDLMGSIPSGNTPLNPRTKLIQVTDHWRAYNVLLDVVDGVEAYGQLIIPNGSQARFPVVICQHGIGGSPKDVTGIGKNPSPIYRAFAAQLAERGYVTFAPYVCTPQSRGLLEGVQINPLVRQAASLGKMRTSIELAKLRRIVDFLQTLPFVDAERIGYYGLSYGGYDATWMPPLDPRLKLTIISGYFNDWRSKLTDEEESASFMVDEDEDYYNWDVLNRFTHLELIASMWPRGVCIEWGIRDAVTPPAWHWRAWGQVEEWIRAWNVDNVRDAVFDGPHRIDGVETFEFLDIWLKRKIRTASN